MAPRTPIRQSQALPVNGAQGGAGAAGGAGAGGRAAAAAAARDQNPPWRSSLDLVWSYSRSQAFYGDNIGTSPSFADRRWAGPHRASIAEESDVEQTHGDEGEYDEELDSEYEDEEDDYEDDDYAYDEYEEDDGPDNEAADKVPGSTTAALSQAEPHKGRQRDPPQGRTHQQQDYFSSDDEQDHLGRRRSKLPSTRPQLRAALAQQEQQQHQPDSSALDTSSAVSGTDHSTVSDIGSAATGDDWEGEQLPPNAIQRSNVPAQQRQPSSSSTGNPRRRRQSRNPPSAYRGPRGSIGAGGNVATGGTGTDSDGAGPSSMLGRGLGRRKRSMDRNSIDSGFSARRPSRKGLSHRRASTDSGAGQYGAADHHDVEAGRGSSEGAPLLGGASDTRRLSRISSHRTMSGFSTAVRSPKFIESQGTSTFLQSWFNTLNALIGVGVLALPLAFAVTGPILGPVLFLLAGLLTNYTGKVLAKIMARNPQLRTYADVGTFAFGPSARWVVTALFCLELWAVSTALIILFGDSVSAVAQVGSPALWKVIGFLIILPTVFLPLKFLSPISVVGIISTITLFVVVLADGLIKKEAPGSLWEPRVDSLLPLWSRLPLSFGLIMSGFSSHPVIPSLFKDMQQPHRFPQMLDRAYLVATIIYLGMGLAGYLMFGSDVTDEITRDLARIKEYPRVLNQIAIWLIIINPLAKFALAARPITTTAELIFGVEKSQAYIQEALERQLDAQREEEEAFMAGNGGGRTGRNSHGVLPPRRSSGALSVSGTSRGRRSADLSAVRGERRRSQLASGTTGKATTQQTVTTEAQTSAADEDEAIEEVSTPTQAALFNSGNPFARGASDKALSQVGALKQDQPLRSVEGTTSPPEESSPLPAVATLGGRAQLSIDPQARARRPSQSRVSAVAAADPTSDEALMGRALNDAGLSPEDINPLAASSFSMRMAKLTARQGPAFRNSARVGVKVAVTMLITLTAILIPGFEKVMAFLGAFLAFASCVFGPLLAHLRIFHRSMSKVHVAMDIAILSLSFVAAALGTVWAFLPR